MWNEAESCRAQAGPADPPAGWRSWADAPPPELLELVVRHPAAGICVVIVRGELDCSTAPALERCVHEQVAEVPAHLILDLEQLCFMGARGLSCLLEIRACLERIGGSQLHLAGLITRRVARPLHITGLLNLFNTYPTLPQALAALTD